MVPDLWVEFLRGVQIVKSEESNRPTLREDLPLIAAALRLAAREAVREHAQAGYAVPVDRDGKVVWIAPAEILANLANDETSEA